MPKISRGVIYHTRQRNQVAQRAVSSSELAPQSSVQAIAPRSPVQMAHIHGSSKASFFPPSPIDSLFPVEIICKIFEALAALDPDARMFKYIRPSCSVAWKVAHVCRRWRDIALKVPDLWTTIPGSFTAEAARAWISRTGPSKLLTIGVHYPISRPKQDGWVDLLLPLTHRLQALVISGTPCDAMGLLIDILNTTDMPELRYLTLNGQCSVGRRGYCYRGIMKSSGIKAYMQSLVHLSIGHGFFFPYRFYRFTMLRELEIGGGATALRWYLTTYTILNALNSLSGSLEVLRIDAHRLFDTHATDVEPPSVVTLSRLHSLYFKGCATDSSQFFFSTIRAQAIIHFSLSLHLTDEVELARCEELVIATSPLIPACENVLIATRPPPRDGRIVFVGNYEPIGWAESELDLSNLTAASNVAFVLSIAGPAYIQLPNRERLISSTISALPTQHVTRLALRVPDDLPFPYAPAFLAFSGVTLFTQLDDSPRVLAALQPGISGGVHLPDLRRLVSIIPSSVAGLDVKRFYNTLLAMGKARKAAGLPRPGVTLYKKTKTAWVSRYLDDIFFADVMRGKDWGLVSRSSEEEGASIESGGAI